MHERGLQREARLSETRDIWLHAPPVRWYVGPGMLAAQIVGRRAELAFLRSTWPRRSSQPAGIAPEMTTPTAATLADSPSPEVAVAAADGATDDAMTEGPEAGTAGPALGADTSIDFPNGATLGFATAPTLPPSEPVASASDGRPVHVLLASPSTLPPTVAPLSRSAHPIREWRQHSLLVSLSPPSPTVVQPEFLAFKSPPSQRVAPLPQSAHPIGEYRQPSLLVSPSPPSPTVVQHEFLACKSPPS